MVEAVGAGGDVSSAVTEIGQTGGGTVEAVPEPVTEVVESEPQVSSTSSTTEVVESEPQVSSASSTDLQESGSGGSTPTSSNDNDPFQVEQAGNEEPQPAEEFLGQETWDNLPLEAKRKLEDVQLTNVQDGRQSVEDYLGPEVWDQLSEDEKEKMRDAFVMQKQEGRNNPDKGPSDVNPGANGVGNKGTGTGGATGGAGGATGGAGGGNKGNGANGVGSTSGSGEAGGDADQQAFADFENSIGEDTRVPAEELLGAEWDDLSTDTQELMEQIEFHDVGEFSEELKTLAQTIAQMIEQDSDFKATITQQVQGQGIKIGVADLPDAAGMAQLSGNVTVIDIEYVSDPEVIAHEILHLLGLDHGEEHDKAIDENTDGDEAKL